MGKPTRLSGWFFTEAQRKELLPIWNDNQEAFGIFNKEIAPAMTQACRPKITLGEKRELQRKAVASADKFMDDIRKCDVFWDLWNSQDGAKELEGLWSLRRKLEVFSEELRERDKRTSKHETLAFAIGEAMAKSGLEVSGYYNNSTYKPPRLGNAAKVIGICNEATGLARSRNLKQLAQIAKNAANLTSN